MGLLRLCKQFGGLIFNGEEWIYDYENDMPCKKSDLSKKEIERIETYKWKQIMKEQDKLKSP